MKKHDNPLAHWLRDATAEDRERLATLAGTGVNYLFQLAAGRREPKVQLAFAIEEATEELWRETGGRLAIVTAREIAQIQALSGL